MLSVSGGRLPPSGPGEEGPAAMYSDGCTPGWEGEGGDGTEERKEVEEQ